jgi:hypothetical protein
MYWAREVIVAEGVIALPPQFIFGAIFSLVCVGIAALAGLILRLPVFSRLWYSTLVPVVVLLVCAMVLLLRGEGWGLTGTSTESDSTYQTLHPAVAYGSLFAILFAILHFPRPAWLRKVPPSFV